LAEHETHPPSRAVRPHPFEIAKARDLLLAGGLAVEHHGRVAGDELRLGVLRRILEAGLRIVEIDLLGVALDLLVAGLIATEPEQRARVIGDEHRESLGGAAGRADRSR